MATIVEITAGRVSGVTEDGLEVFKGIPYAAPPIGALRWRPPQPVTPWAGVRPADHFGYAAPQNTDGRPDTMTGEKLPQDEDCLTLNVWTPGVDGAKRPVMVWIHGGAFVTGSGAGELYWGDRLARRGDVVVVTANYRLGALGFLAHPDLCDPETGTSGSWGVLDQLAALQWVQDNIAGFGGDPANVTVFGESAGAMSVSTLLGMPAARGLFAKAIAQSGGPVGVPFETGITVTERFAAELGLADNIAGLRDAPVPQLLAAQHKVGTTMTVGGTLPFVPVIDGVAVPEPPLAQLQAGLHARTPVLTGTNRDEMTFFSIGDPSSFSLDQERLLRRVTRLLGDRDAAQQACDTYAKARADRGQPAAPSDVWMALQSDYVFRIPCIRLLEAQTSHGSDAYGYLFTWPSPAIGGILGACHALELPFVFGHLDLPNVELFTGCGPLADRLSEHIQDAWLSFARTGRPVASDGDDWPAYGSDRSTMVLDAEWAIDDDPMAPERRFWDGRL